MFRLIFCILIIVCSHSIYAQQEVEVVPVIYGDFPKGEEIDPEIINLNGIDLRDNVFNPGTYNLEIAHPGYKTINETITISQGEEFVLERTMESVPRKVYEIITYEVEPPKLSYDIRYFRKGKWLDLRKNSFLKPGKYRFKIRQNGYDEVDKIVTIWPSNQKFFFKTKLYVQKVSLAVKLIYDIKPPKKLAPPKITVKNAIEKVREIKNKSIRLQPGTYMLTLKQPAYQWKSKEELLYGQRKIILQPGMKNVSITEHLIAKPRKVIPSFTFKNREISPLYIKIYNGNKVETYYSNRIPALATGVTLKFVGRFKKYATIDHFVTIAPGVKAFPLPFHLKKLKQHVFFSFKKHLIMNGKKYPFVFQADKELLNEDRVRVKYLKGQYNYIVNYEPKTSDMKIICGYRYSIYKANHLPFSIGVLSNIDLDRLILHLKKFKKQKATKIVNRIFRRYTHRKRIQGENKEKLKRFQAYLHSWKLKDRAFLKTLTYLKKMISIHKK